MRRRPHQAARKAEAGDERLDPSEVRLARVHPPTPHAVLLEDDGLAPRPRQIPPVLQVVRPEPLVLGGRERPRVWVEVHGCDVRILKIAEPVDPFSAVVDPGPRVARSSGDVGSHALVPDRHEMVAVLTPHERAHLGDPVADRRTRQPASRLVPSLGCSRLVGELVAEDGRVVPVSHPRDAVAPAEDHGDESLPLVPNVWIDVKRLEGETHGWVRNVDKLLHAPEEIPIVAQHDDDPDVPLGSLDEDKVQAPQRRLGEHAVLRHHRRRGNGVEERAEHPDDRRARPCLLPHHVLELGLAHDIVQCGIERVCAPKLVRETVQCEARPLGLDKAGVLVDVAGGGGFVVRKFAVVVVSERVITLGGGWRIPGGDIATRTIDRSGCN